MIKDLIYTNRSYRRFLQHETISMETLREPVDPACDTWGHGKIEKRQSARGLPPSAPFWPSH